MIPPFRNLSSKRVINGRLKKNLIFWQEILSVNSAISEIIDNGYKIPFFKTSKCISFRNNKSVLKNLLKNPSPNC